MDHTQAVKLKKILYDLCLNENQTENILIDDQLRYYVIGEIRDNLFELPNNDSRIAYLKTTLLRFTEPHIEDYIKELVLQYYIYRPENIAEKRGNLHISKATARQRMLINFSKTRNAIILLLSEHIIDVYPEINFSEILRIVNIGTVETFWISPGKTKGITKTGEERYFLDPRKILQSYNDFKTTIFVDGYAYKDYLSCFDLNNTPSNYPVFRGRKQIDFVYFLSQIDSLKVNCKIAKDQFGIKKYKQAVFGMANRTPVFINQVEAILKKR